MPHVELSSGTIDYEDSVTGRSTIVLVHGLLMDSSLWSGVTARLSPDFRCVAPTFPLGSHQRPMRPGADLSPGGLAALLEEFLDALDLGDVTLVVNDVSYPQVLAANNSPRVSRLVLTPCEAFDNMPPGLPGAVVALAARLPGGLWLALQSLRMPGAQRLPFTFGRMASRSIPRKVLERWLAPSRKSRRIRADLRAYSRAARPEWQAAVTRALADFRGPALILWGPDDKVMPFRHAELMAEQIARAELVPVAGARTLMPLELPDVVADQIRRFLDGTTSTR